MRQTRTEAGELQIEDKVNILAPHVCLCKASDAAERLHRQLFHSVCVCVFSLKETVQQPYMPVLLKRDLAPFAIVHIHLFKLGTH